MRGDEPDPGYDMAGIHTQLEELARQTRIQNKLLAHCAAILVGAIGAMLPGDTDLKATAEFLVVIAKEIDE